ncbi:hypothetical protein LguiA_036196 [Lonicera macranthoides]
METSARIFNSYNRRHLSTCLLSKPHPLKFKPPHPSSPFPLPRHTFRSPPAHSNPKCYTPLPSSNPSPLWLGFPQSLPSFHSSNSPFCPNPFARIVSGPQDKSIRWNFSSQGLYGGDLGFVDNKGPIVTVVLLGWLGSEPKHLRRYVELYNSKGINAVTFVASVKDVLSLDLGRRLQERISALAMEIAEWLSETEKDGRERFLLFHTFSNTGWLAYGAILDDLQGRRDLLEKIKGCIFDSGGDPDLNPKVWAAGFTAALLKKRSSVGYSPVETEEVNKLENGSTVYKIGKKEPPLIEVFLLLLFEKLFSFLLNSPDINQRLSKIISALSKTQPPCPQLYLYSTADKVIPFKSVESFIEAQRKMGRKVLSYNFGSSPHVDHYRTFPGNYSSQVQSFLKECLTTVKQM